MAMSREPACGTTLAVSDGRQVRIYWQYAGGGVDVDLGGGFSGG